jgi:hypothetical protein
MPPAELKGAPAFQDRLGRIADGLGDLSPAHAEISRQIESDAARRAPRLTGRLAGSVRAEVSERGAVVTAGANLPYGPVIHWGWPARGIPARPFLAEAIGRAEKTYLQTYTDVVQAIVDRT